MIFYKKNKKLPYLSFIDENYYAEILIEWDEKIESPLSGTTKKKNYRTTINFLKYEVFNYEIQNYNKLYSIKAKQWILPENFFVISIDPVEIYYLYHESNDVSGQNRKLGKIKNMEIQYLEIDNLRALLPSPDKTKLFLLSQNNKFLLYDVIKGKIVQDKNPNFEIFNEQMITWDSDSKKIYVYLNEKVYSYDIIKNQVEIAKEFPECIHPTTTMGSALNGKEYAIHYDYETKQYILKKFTTFLSFKDKKLINDIRKVRFQCKE